MIRKAGRTPLCLSGLGLLLALGIVMEWVYIVTVSNPLGSAWLAGVATSLPFAIGLIYAGYWLRQSHLSPTRHPRIEGWCLAGLIGFLGINVILMVALSPGSASEFSRTGGTFQVLSWGRWASTLGAGTGACLGLLEARAVEREVTAERARIRAKEAETRRELLSYLNATLRHEVLNAADVIRGYAALSKDRYEGNEELSEWLEIIEREARDMETVIEDVRALLRASSGNVKVQPVDVTELLHEEADNLRVHFEDVDVEISAPERTIVPANQALKRVFSNLMWNAVEHNDSETPRVSVTVEEGPNRVVVRISDNGPGIPEEKLETLFEPEIDNQANHGLGLPLATTILRNFDGTIDLVKSGSDGTEFRIEFPRAEDMTSRMDSSATATSALSDGGQTLGREKPR